MNTLTIIAICWFACAIPCVAFFISYGKDAQKHGDPNATDLSIIFGSLITLALGPIGLWPFLVGFYQALRRKNKP